MKKFFTLLTIVAMAFAACEPVDQPNNETPGNNENPGNVEGPQIKLKSKSEMTIGCGSVMASISYELINPEEGLEVKAESSVEWLGNFDHKNMGKVSFRSQANPTENPRVGVITVSYGDSSVEVTITQEGNPLPTEIDIEVPELTGHYYGLIEGLYNFYLVFTDKGMSSYEAIYGINYFNVADAYYYVVDLYLDKPKETADGEPIIVPNGTYGFDKASQGWPNMFGHEFSWLQYNDASGFSLSQTQFDNGELLVEDGKVTLTVTMTVNGLEESHTVVYEGDYELIDMTSLSYM